MAYGIRSGLQRGCDRRVHRWIHWKDPSCRNRRERNGHRSGHLSERPRLVRILDDDGLRWNDRERAILLWFDGALVRFTIRAPVRWRPMPYSGYHRDVRALHRWYAAAECPLPCSLRCRRHHIHHHGSPLKRVVPDHTLPIAGSGGPSAPPIARWPVQRFCDERVSRNGAAGGAVLHRRDCTPGPVRSCWWHIYHPPQHCRGPSGVSDDHRMTS